MREASVVTFAGLIEQGVLQIGDGYRAKLEELGGNGPLFLRAGLLTERGVDWGGAERFHEALAAKVQSKLGRAGDTIITTKGNSTGRTGYVPPDAPAFVYSPHLSYWRSLDHRQLVPGFLRYWAQGPELLAQLRAMAHSTDMAPYLSLVDQQRLRISLPTPVEQNAIAEVLGALDDKIELNREMISISRRLARLLFRRWHAMNGVSVHLSDVADITMGSSPPGSTYNEIGAGLPFYQGIRDFGVRFPVRRIWCSEPVRTAQPWDILVSVRAPVGALNVAREVCCIGRGLAAVRSQPRRSALLYALEDAASSWEPYKAEGTVFGSINKAALSSLKIPWLANHEAEEFEALARPLDELVLIVDLESLALAKLRDLLLPRLLSGELRVCQVDKLAEVAT